MGKKEGSTDAIDFVREGSTTDTVVDNKEVTSAGSVYDENDGDAEGKVWEVFYDAIEVSVEAFWFQGSC